MVYGTQGEVQVDITSTKPTSGSVQLLDGTTVISSGTAAADGSATLAIPGTALAVGPPHADREVPRRQRHRAVPGDGQVTVARPGRQRRPRSRPSEVVVRQGIATVQASVTAPGYTPTGSIQFLVDGVVVATEALSSGSAFAEVGPFATVGERT